MQWLRSRPLLIVTLAVLVLLAVSGTVDGVFRLSHERALASDGMRHLRAAQALLPNGQAFNAVLDPAIMPKLRQDLAAAEQDFSALRANLGSPAGTLFLAAHTPGVGSAISSADLLAAAADEVCLAGITMTQVATPFQAYIHGGVFAKSAANTNKPPPAPLTAATLTEIRATWDTALVHLNNAVGFAGQADLSTLPGSLVSTKQVAELRSLLAKWPAIQAQLNQVDTWLALAPTLLGVTAPERFLLLLQDRTELRATGGFMGNNALVTLQSGRIQPFHLEDTYLLDRPYTAQYGALPIPPGYPWWPFQLFALRDANLSPDFPTSARLEQRFYQQETGQSVSGVIAITPALIEAILNVTGSIRIPGYPDVVTATNLEPTIHKYQLGIGTSSGQERKAFTAALGQSLLASVQKLSLAQQAHLVTLALTLFRSRDIQMWLADPNAEALLATDGVDSSLPHGQRDAVTIVDTNIGANKANQFVNVKYADQVTIDAQGAATHHLTITYSFHATNVVELYGADRYHTYLRIYVPVTASLRTAKGFNFAYISPNSFGPSDISGHHMWAGEVLVQDGIRYTLSLVWTVPHAAQRDSAGHWRYPLVFQHQPASLQYLTLTVTMPGQSHPIDAYKGWLSTDEAFNLVS